VNTKKGSTSFQLSISNNKQGRRTLKILLYLILWGVIKMKPGDLIIEILDSNFLILLTRVNGNYGTGYILDRALPISKEYIEEYEEDGIDGIELTGTGKPDDYRIKLKKCIFVARVGG